MTQPVPRPSSQPDMMAPRVVASEAEFIDLIRDRLEQLDISHATVDHITGWADGLTGKLLAPVRMKRFGIKSMPLILAALALRVARIEFTHDPVQAARVSSRWTKRQRRPVPRKALWCVVAQGEPMQDELTFGDNPQETHTTMSGSENFTMRVDPEFKRRIAEAAAQARRKPSDFVRLAVLDAIAAKEPKQGEAA